MFFVSLQCTLIFNNPNVKHRRCACVQSSSKFLTWLHHAIRLGVPIMIVRTRARSVRDECIFNNHTICCLVLITSLISINMITVLALMWLDSFHLRHTVTCTLYQSIYRFGLCWSKLNSCIQYMYTLVLATCSSYWFQLHWIHHISGYPPFICLFCPERNDLKRYDYWRQEWNSLSLPTRFRENIEA